MSIYIYDKAIIEKFKEKKIPYIVVMNKLDLVKEKNIELPLEESPNTMWVITSTTAIDSRVPEKKTENTGIPSPICLPIVYKRIGMNTITIKAATAPEHNTVKK